MKRFCLALLASALLVACTSNAAAPSAEPQKSSKLKEFEQANVASTPLRVVFARRTDWYHDFGSELRATSPEKDAVLVLRLDGITPAEFQKIDRERMSLVVGDQKRALNIASSGIINGKAAIVLATTVPRSASEVRLVLGDITPAVLRLKGPIVPEVTETE
jgi:hypothetical protein